VASGFRPSPAPTLRLPSIDFKYLSLNQIRQIRTGEAQNTTRREISLLPVSSSNAAEISHA
jgi:hypothetical protein